MTISEIKERLQRLTEPLYPKYREEYQEYSLDELKNALNWAEKGLLPEIWETSSEWDFGTAHEFDSYTCCRAIRDELVERLGYLEREFIHDQIGYDS